MPRSKIGLPRNLAWRLKLLSDTGRVSLRSGRHNPLGFVASMRKSFSLYKKYGFLPVEGQQLGLHQFTGKIEDHYISKAHLVKLQKRLNHPSFQPLTEDKALFYITCLTRSIPVPNLYGIFLKKASGLHYGVGPLTGEREWGDFFERNCPDEFVVKPSTGVYGNDILFVDKKACPFSGTDLYHRLDSHPAFDSFVIQECLTNHPDLMSLNPKKGLQTIRIITMIGRENRPEILMAYLKPIVGDNRIDNQKHGTTGNLLCPIDLVHGTLSDLFLIGDSGLVRLEHHPDTGVLFKSRSMPHWPEVRDLALLAAKSFLPMRCIGWDIAVSTSGAVIVEGNSRWDPPSFGNLGGVIQTLSAACQ